jgi:SAM-dependent methyltransferase
MTDPGPPDPAPPSLTPAAGTIHPAAATGFERGADDYERSRPSYPPAALDHITSVMPITTRSRVLDLGAGTGKLTRLLLSTGAHLWAIEPVPAMRRKVTVLCPDVEILDGTAESIPLPDASLDAVLVAQAFHWFDQPVALAEIARVLRPHGGLSIIWNNRDTSVGWVQRFGDILTRHGGTRPYELSVRTDPAPVVARSGLFTPVEVVSFANPVPASPDLVVARAASTSFVSALADGPRAACLAEVRELCATEPELAGRDRFDFPHVTYVNWCHAL